MEFEQYQNLSGASPVVEFKIGPDFILVKYKQAPSNEATPKNIYKYTDKSAGHETVREMISLARAGKGLATYISQEKPCYEGQEENPGPQRTSRQRPSKHEIKPVRPAKSRQLKPIKGRP